MRVRFCLKPSMKTGARPGSSKGHVQRCFLVRRIHKSTCSAVVALSLLCSPQLFAQNIGGNAGQGQGAGQGQAGGGAFPGGIVIDAAGVVSSVDAARVNPLLQQKRLQALARKNLPVDVATPSDLRLVSLVGVEQECRRALDAGRRIPDTLQCLAGITQIQFLFAMPETNDLVIGGPAEGFAATDDGRMVGVESGRPVLTLDDLLTMMRLPGTHTRLGCSFDPDPGRLANAQSWNQNNRSPVNASMARKRFQQMSRILGNWNVSVFGIPASCHAALTVVEADFDLKQLALGHRRPKIRSFRSHLDLARPGENTMRRWWFAPRYDVIEQSADGLAFRIAGPRLQLLSQEELVDAQGNRSDAAFTEISAERYTKQFNRHIDALCQQVPSFAAVQNIFDLAVVAALIHRYELDKQIDWAPALLKDGQTLPLQRYEIPTQVPSQVNVKSSSRRLLMGVIGGGVVIVPDDITNRTVELQAEDIPELARTTASGRWWWDAAEYP